MVLTFQKQPVLPPQPKLEDLPLIDQFNFHENLKAKERLWRSGKLLAIVCIAIGITVKPANDLLKWSWRFAGLPTTDTLKLAISKEYKPSDVLNMPLKEGDIVSGFPVTSAYGERDKPNADASSDHKGVDIGTPVGTPLYVIGRPKAGSAFTGYADVFCSLPMANDARGYAAYVKSADFPDIEFVYYHLKANSCTSGRLEPGTKFAETGDTGNSTGPHLHFGTKLRGDWTKADFRDEWFEPKRWHVQWTLEGREPSKEPVVATPNVKAFLGAIRYAEGTDHADGYRTIFTGAKFDDFSKHPDTVKCAIGPEGKEICSAAAGAYQYMPDTWAWVSKEINAKDFSPENQERGAIALLKKRGVLDLIEKGEISTAFTKVCEEWASVSCDKNSIEGAYPNQAVKPISELMKVYKKKKEGK